MPPLPGRAPKLRPITLRDVDAHPLLRQHLTPRQRRALHVVGAVLPFRSDRYVVEELIDWDRVPDDPLFRLAFPREEMLPPADLAALDRLLGAEGAAA